MASMGTQVVVDADGDVVRVTLEGAGRLNAQLPSTWAALARVGAEVGSSVRAVVLQGAGGSFSSGLDRRMLSAEGVPGEPSLADVVASGDEGIDAFIGDAQAAFTWWRTCPAITIAALRGHTIGAGAQLALACDIAIAADDLQFALPEATLGLVPDLGGTSPLVSRIGYHRALALCATGRAVGADEAVRIGLVEQIVPTGELDSTIDLLIGRLRAVPLEALRALKPLLDGADRHPDQLARERRHQAPLLAALVASSAPQAGRSR